MGLQQQINSLRAFQMTKVDWTMRFNLKWDSTHTLLIQISLFRESRSHEYFGFCRRGVAVRYWLTSVSHFTAWNKASLHGCALHSAPHDPSSPSRRLASSNSKPPLEHLESVLGNFTSKESIQNRNGDLLVRHSMLTVLEGTQTSR